MEKNQIINKIEQMFSQIRFTNEQLVVLMQLVILLNSLDLELHLTNQNKSQIVSLINQIKIDLKYFSKLIFDIPDNLKNTEIEKNILFGVNNLIYVKLLGKINKIQISIN